MTTTPTRPSNAEVRAGQSEPILCYVSGEWAYFTTLPLPEQWGDDWNDRPYEHNAGSPYEWREDYRNPGSGVDYEGRPPWKITEIAYQGNFREPREGHFNSPYSVQDINAGAVPWLVYPYWQNEPERARIMAGTPFSEFCRTVLECGGMVYLPVTMQNEEATDADAG